MGLRLETPVRFLRRSSFPSVDCPVVAFPSCAVVRVIAGDCERERGDDVTADVIGKVWVLYALGMRVTGLTEPYLDR